MEINQPQILRIFPSEVNFNSIQVDTEYICSISVQNTDLVPHKIRLGCPTNRNFKINKTCTIIIASGLEFKFDLYFKCSKLQDYHDTVKISMEDEIFEVPIHAYIPKPVLLVDSFLDFGSIIVGSNVTKYLEIVNEGEIEGSYNFTHDKGLPIEVKPMKGVLQAKTLISGDTSNKIRIEIKFSANNVGIFRESLILHSSDSTDRIIDLNATVVDRKVDFLLLPERSIVTELDYGTLFYNKRKVLSTVLINNSPQPLSYNIIYNYDPNDDVSVHSSTSMNVNEKPVKISSTTGIIAPYDEMKIDFTLFVLLPKLPIKGRLTTEPVEITQLNENIVIELLDSNQTLSFSILADLVRPLVSISKQFVNFENCNTSDRRDETITITNKCTKLPIKWETTTIAQFKISPPNGILHPSQSQNIIVSFVPQQLGVFKDLIQFVFERGIVVIPLRLQGECEVVGQKLKYSQVLNQEPKFIMSVEKDIKPQFSRQEPWEEYPSQSMIIEEENIASSYTFGISDQIKMKEFKQKYNSFIRPNKTIPKSPKIDLNDINLGMKPYEGLKEPELEIPKKVDKLWLKKPINEIIKPKTNLSISKVEPKKYKSTPSSPAEAAACQMKLSDEELINIQAGPLLIQFNTMTVNSKITKIFTVFNDLQQCIMASIDIKQEELKETNPLVQIIPPGKMGKFDMTFSSSKEVQFEESIYFTINGNHKMKLKVLAMVVPLYLNISRDTIKFNFPDDNLEKSMTEVFTMVNPGTIEAEYIWSTQENDPYQIIPKNGVIRVGETVTFQIKFTPFYRCLTDMIFKCMINNGKTTVLRCIAGSLGGVLKVPEKPTILGLIPVGLPTVVDVKIQNTSNVTVVFYASCDLPEILINNKKCRIEVLEYFTLSITFLPQKEFIYTEENAIINISTRGGLDYKLSFTAESKIPKIEIVEDEYNFGTVIIGSQTKKGITIQNIENIASLLLLDLTEYGEFDISEEDKNQIGGKTGITIYSSSKNNRQYQINIEPHDTIKFTLNFYPKKAQVYSFELPISILGNNLNEKNKRIISAEAIVPIFVLSEGFYDFGRKIVPYDRMRVIPYLHEIIITNKDDKPIDWEIGDIKFKENYDSTVFRIRPTSGHLISDDSMKLSLEFVPDENKEYVASIPIYINNDMSNEYTTIETIGKGILPKLTFNMEEVILPVITLKEKSTREFIIYNYGYDNMELKHKFPLEGSKLPLTLSYPKGNKIGYGTTEIPVIITFTPQKATSFTTRLDFYDLYGNKFSIMVTGTADNCLFTNYGFIESYAGKYKIGLDNKNIPSLILNKGFKSGELIETLNAKSPTGENEKILIKFFNEVVSPNPLSSIEYLINDQGLWLSLLIEYLINKKLTNKIKNYSKKYEERLVQIIDLYSEILYIIKSYGGLLNEVDPINLLPIEDYVNQKTFKYMQNNPDDHNTNNMQKLQQKYKSEHLKVSHDNWMVVLYQIVKVFVLNKITINQYQNLPGMNLERRMTESELSSSIYSIPESILLRWLLYHHKKVHGGLIKQAFSFTEHIRNGSVLCHLLLSHVPDLNEDNQPLSNIIDIPKNENEIRHNFQHFFLALNQLRIGFIPSEDFFMKGNDRDLLLYFIYLYQTLPYYTPKSNLVFSGVLGQLIEKNIQLKNPSNKLLTYEIEYTGSTDYNINSDVINISTDEVLDYPISILARFNKPITGKLIFWGKKTIGLSCAPLIFNLETKITAKTPMKIIQTNTVLYTPFNVEILVENPYPYEGHYDITVIQKYKSAETKKTSKSKYSEAKSLIHETDTDMVFDSTNGFHTSQRKITIQSKGTNKLNVQFLPFYRGKYECDIIFTDVKVGEFSYQIQGDAEMPDTIEKFRIVTDQNTLVQKMLKISPINPLLEKAREAVLDRYFGSTRNKMKELLRSSLESITNSTAPYAVETTNHNCNLQSKMNIARSENDYKPLEIITSTLVKDENILNFILNPKGSGTYTCQLYIYSGSDFRSYLIEVVVNDKNIKTTLEFCTNSRQTIQQEIPISNGTDVEWELNSILNTEYFSCDKQIKVQPHSTNSLILKFQPDWICNVSGDLILDNLKTGEKFYFFLKGVGEEPLMEQNLTFECKAREEIEYTFIVPNTLARTTKFIVESDVPHISGDSLFYINGNTKYSYQLKFKPLLGGKYVGSIIFKREDGQYYWYNVTLNVTSPDPDGKIEVETNAREGSSLSISLTNPLSHAVDLDVILVGKGLLGDSIFHIEPNTTGVYELLFLVLLPSEQNGSVTFINQDIGEFWYQLHLIANQAPIIKLDKMTCAIGNKTQQIISIENPINEELELKSKISNLTNYSIKPSILSLKPYSTGTVAIEYCPSSLEAVESAELMFYNAQVGEFRYHVDGIGTAPSLMSEMLIECEIRQSVSKSLVFRNPFPISLNVTVQMQSNNESNSILYTVLPKKIHVINPFNILQIPLIFTPKDIIKYTSILTITTLNLPNQLTWSYPIIGIGEGLQCDEIYKYECKSRTEFTQIINLKLNNLELVDPESFKYEIKAINIEQSTLDNILEIEPLLEILSQPTDQLRYLIRLFSYKPISLAFDIIVHRENGGQWKFPFNINITQSDPDDILVIYSNLNQLSSLSFNLTNTISEDSPFEAYFTTESPSNFNVYPNSGLLTQIGSKGVDFVVSFKPSQYGKEYIGVLVINTTDMQWIYEIHGRHPDYERPEGSTKLITKLSPNLQNRLKMAKVTTTNHVTSNIQKIKKNIRH